MAGNKPEGPTREAAAPAVALARNPPTRRGPRHVRTQTAGLQHFNTATKNGPDEATLIRRVFLVYVVYIATNTFRRAATTNAKQSMPWSNSAGMPYEGTRTLYVYSTIDEETSRLKMEWAGKGDANSNDRRLRLRGRRR